MQRKQTKSDAKQKNELKTKKAAKYLPYAAYLAV